MEKKDDEQERRLEISPSDDPSTFHDLPVELKAYIFAMLPDEASRRAVALTNTVNRAIVSDCTRSEIRTVIHRFYQAVLQLQANPAGPQEFDRLRQSLQPHYDLIYAMRNVLTDQDRQQINPLIRAWNTLVHLYAPQGARARQFSRIRQGAAAPPGQPRPDPGPDPGNRYMFY